jgi:hypothetical protein
MAVIAMARGGTFPLRGSRLMRLTERILSINRGHASGLGDAVCNLCGVGPRRVELCFFVVISFVGWGETESTWYFDQYLAYCTSPGL